ncbi:MAG TPA: DUF4126 family protein [Bryobacteraceae bacterium]
MSASQVLLPAFLIGAADGLRSLTAPAAVAWAAHLGWLNLIGTPLSFMGSTASVAIFTVLAIGELVADKLPSTPSRTAPPGLIARIVLGGLSGACVAAAGAQSAPAGAGLGVAGGLAGTFAGYQARTHLVRALKVPDLVIALLEDAVAVGGSLFLVSRFFSRF